MVRLGCFLTLLLLLVASAFPQGSAAGYGQGGFGGGGGGMAGGRAGNFGDASTDEGHPEDDNSVAGLYETRTAILTPGDRVEFKLKVEKGQTLFAGATSEAFDPALSVEDASGKLLAKNDDREEGDQAPFVAVRFPEAGTYTLRVLSYKQAAGGKFTLKLRTLTALDVPLGPSNRSFTAQDGVENVLDVRLSAKKGVVYDLSRSHFEGPLHQPPYFLRIVGPTGVEKGDLERIDADGAPVFRASSDGDYYVEYRIFESGTLAMDVREVPVYTAKLDGEQTVALDAGNLAIVEFPVEPKLLVRTTLTGDSVAYRFTAPRTAGVATSAPDPAFGYDAGWTWFKLDRDSDRDVVRLFRTYGTARVAVRSQSSVTQHFTVRNSTSLPEWISGKPIHDTLKIGEIRLFLLRSTKSEIMHVAATSPSFQPRLDIFQMDGRLANILVDRTRHDASDDLYFPQQDTYLVRLSCDGYGGSGEVTLAHQTPAPTPYRLGTTAAVELNGTNFGLYAVTLEAGKRYQLVLDDSEAPIRTDLLDAEGTFLVGQQVTFDKVSVQYFVPTRSGVHRLWLRGPAGTRRFRLEPSVPPSLSSGVKDRNPSDVP